MKHFGDITKLNGAELPVVDCISFGAPCQDLSVAGKRAGMKNEAVGDDETTRSGLFYDAVRIIEEMRSVGGEAGRANDMGRPARYAIYENVPGAFSSNKGRDWQAVLTALVRVADPTAPDVPLPKKGRWPRSGVIYDEMGKWSVAWRLHDAQWFGVAQRRKRVCCLADYDGLTAWEILFDPQYERTTEDGVPLSLERHPGAGDGSEVRPFPGSVPGGIKERGKEKGPPAGAEGGAGGPISFQERAGEPGGGKGLLIQHDMVCTLSTVNNQRVVVPAAPCKVAVDLYNNVVCGDVAPTLVAASGGSNTSGPKVLSLDEKMGRFYCWDDQANTLAARDNKQPQAVFCVQGNVVDRDAKQGGIGVAQDVSYTLNVVGRHAVCAVDCRNARETLETNGTLQAKPSGGASLNLNNVIRDQRKVRRLIPDECASLQGFPRDWCNIGPWRDSKGKLHKDADGPKYRAYGNSIAVGYANGQRGFWCWLARRICAQYERQITLGSLFDGIGGFALAFEAAGAKAVWASEIEEFPIAVTKVHFPEGTESKYIEQGEHHEGN